MGGMIPWAGSPKAIKKLDKNQLVGKLAIVPTMFLHVVFASISYFNFYHNFPKYLAMTWSRKPNKNLSFPKLLLGRMFIIPTERKLEPTCSNSEVVSSSLTTSVLLIHLQMDFSVF